MKNSKSQGALEKSQLQSQSKTDNKSNEQGSESEYKCDNCNFTCIEKVKLSAHILKEHEKCKVCTTVFQNSKSMDAHIEGVHKKPKLKHTLERDPSLKKYNNKKNN